MRTKPPKKKKKRKRTGRCQPKLWDGRAHVSGVSGAHSSGLGTGGAGLASSSRTAHPGQLIRDKRAPFRQDSRLGVVQPPPSGPTLHSLVSSLSLSRPHCVTGQAAFFFCTWTFLCRTSVLVQRATQARLGKKKKNQCGWRAVVHL